MMPHNNIVAGGCVRRPGPPVSYNPLFKKPVEDTKSGYESGALTLEEAVQFAVNHCQGLLNNFAARANLQQALPLLQYFQKEAIRVMVPEQPETRELLEKITKVVAAISPRVTLPPGLSTWDV